MNAGKADWLNVAPFDRLISEPPRIGRSYVESSESQSTNSSQTDRLRKCFTEARRSNAGLSRSAVKADVCTDDFARSDPGSQFTTASLIVRCDGTTSMRECANVSPTVESKMHRSSYVVVGHYPEADSLLNPVSLLKDFNRLIGLIGLGCVRELADMLISCSGTNSNINRSRGHDSFLHRADDGLFRLGDDDLHFMRYNNLYATHQWCNSRSGLISDKERRNILARRYTVQPDFDWGLDYFRSSLNANEDEFFAGLLTPGIGQRSHLLRMTCIALLALECRIPTPFMHTAWHAERVKWARNVAACSDVRELAFLLRRFETAVKPMVFNPSYFEGIAAVSFHRETTVERDERRKEETLNRKRVESELSSFSGSVPKGLKSSLWRLKGEEYRLLGGGWCWDRSLCKLEVNFNSKKASHSVNITPLVRQLASRVDGESRSPEKTSSDLTSTVEDDKATVSASVEQTRDTKAGDAYTSGDASTPTLDRSSYRPLSGNCSRLHSSLERVEIATIDISAHLSSDRREGSSGLYSIQAQPCRRLDGLLEQREKLQLLLKKQLDASLLSLKIRVQQDLNHMGLSEDRTTQETFQRGRPFDHPCPAPCSESDKASCNDEDTRLSSESRLSEKYGLTNVSDEAEERAQQTLDALLRSGRRAPGGVVIVKYNNDTFRLPLCVNDSRLPFSLRDSPRKPKTVTSSESCQRCVSSCEDFENLSSESLFAIPKHLLCRLARKGGNMDVPGFKDSRHVVWPFPCGKPVQRTVWCWRTSSAKIISAIALQLKLLWMSLRVELLSSVETNFSGETLPILQAERGRILRRRDIGPNGLLSEYLVVKDSSPGVDVDKNRTERKYSRSSTKSKEEWIPESFLSPLQIYLFFLCQQRAYASQNKAEMCGRKRSTGDQPEYNPSTACQRASQATEPNLTPHDSGRMSEELLKAIKVMKLGSGGGEKATTGYCGDQNAESATELDFGAVSNVVKSSGFKQKPASESNVSPASSVNVPVLPVRLIRSPLSVQPIRIFGRSNVIVINQSSSDSGSTGRSLRLPVLQCRLARPVRTTQQTESALRGSPALLVVPEQCKTGGESVPALSAGGKGRSNSEYNSQQRILAEQRFDSDQPCVQLNAPLPAINAAADNVRIVRVVGSRFATDSSAANDGKAPLVPAETRTKPLEAVAGFGASKQSVNLLIGSESVNQTIVSPPDSAQRASGPLHGPTASNSHTERTHFLSPATFQESLLDGDRKATLSICRNVLQGIVGAIERHEKISAQTVGRGIKPFDIVAPPKSRRQNPNNLPDLSWLVSGGPPIRPRASLAPCDARPDLSIAVSIAAEDSVDDEDDTSERYLSSISQFKRKVEQRMQEIRQGMIRTLREECVSAQAMNGSSDRSANRGRAAGLSPAKGPDSQTTASVPVKKEKLQRPVEEPASTPLQPKNGAVCKIALLKNGSGSTNKKKARVRCRPRISSARKRKASSRAEDSPLKSPPRLRARRSRCSTGGSSSSKNKQRKSPVKATTSSSNGKEQSLKRPSSLLCICGRPYAENEFYVSCNVCGQWFHGACIGIACRDNKREIYTCADCVKAESDGQLYCICRKPYDESQFYVGCDRCQDWFHGSCVGVTPAQAENMEKYYCPKCRKEAQSVMDIKLTEDLKGVILKLVNDLQAHKMSWPFHEAVSAERYPHYYEVITDPMDLGQLRKNVVSQRYATLSEFVRDATKIFDNCRVFNSVDSVFWQCADGLENHFVRLLNKLKLKLSLGRQTLSTCSSGSASCDPAQVSVSTAEEMIGQTDKIENATAQAT